MKRFLVGISATLLVLFGGVGTASAVDSCPGDYAVATNALNHYYQAVDSGNSQQIQYWADQYNAAWQKGHRDHCW